MRRNDEWIKKNQHISSSLSFSEVTDFTQPYTKLKQQLFSLNGSNLKCFIHGSLFLMSLGTTGITFWYNWFEQTTVQDHPILNAYVHVLHIFPPV